MESFSRHQSGTLYLSCIICHNPIERIRKNEIGDINESGNYAVCPNGHIAHINCLIQWLYHSDSCPVCNTKYAPTVLGRLKPAEPPRKDEKQAEKKIEEQPDPQLIEIEKHLQQARGLIDKGDYTGALKVLFDILDNMDPDNRDALFLIGLANYLRGRYDLAIANLMKLAKKQYDYDSVFYYLGKSYEGLNLKDKANWAYKRALYNIEKKLESTTDPSEINRLRNMKEEIKRLMEC